MTSTLITAAIILGAILIFIIFFALLHKKGHNKKIARQNLVLADIIWKNKLEIIEKEVINNYLLAIDKTNFIFLYINFNAPKEEVVLVDLTQIKTVNVTTDDASVYEQIKGKSVLVDKQVSNLQLEVTLGNAQPKTSLVLYEYKDGMQYLVDIKGRAEYWRDILNNCLQELFPASKQMLGNG